MSSSVFCLRFMISNFIPSRSRDWECPHCKVPNKELLPDPTPDSAKPTSDGSVSEQPPALESPKDTSEACSAGIPVTPKPSEPQGGSNEKASLDDREPHRSTIPSPPVSARPGGSTTSVSPTAATEYLSPPVRRNSYKPPLLLDVAIMALLVLVFVIICRRMV